MWTLISNGLKEFLLNFVCSFPYFSLNVISVSVFSCRWVIYNDRKVAVSENPPRDLAYLYFYKRDSTL